MNSTDREIKISKNAYYFYGRKNIVHIRCAYNDIECCPMCAACDIGGTQNIASCNRNGVDNAFAIGIVVE